MEARMRTIRTFAPGALAAGLLLLAGAAQAAEDCQRGDLDERFCDRDGDMIADPPTDPSEWVDPDTLIFAFTPVEDPAVYREAWADFLTHLEEVTGKPAQFFPVQSNAAQIEAMRSGRLHVAGFNTGSNPLAVNCAGFVPFTIMAALDGSFGYEMEIITHPDNGVETVADIKGKTLAFTAPTSNSGFKAPSALLKAEFDMVEGRDFEATFSGKHDNSVLGVANKDYDAASIANSVKLRMIERGVVDEADLKILYTSQTFPTTGYGYVNNLKPELAEKIKEAFATFEWEGTTLQEEFERNGEGQFIPITYQEHWDVIRKIDAANEVSYDCQ
jgi:phosphonate transport system substrate-binding protein